MAFQIFFTIATFYNLDINQINIKTAFFYEDIDQLHYIQLLKSYYEDQE